MMKICPSKQTIKTFDIFYAPRNVGESRKHYFVCIYSQEKDANNRLFSDIYGLMISTNPKYQKLPENDYNVQIEINEKTCFVLCDKWYRFEVDDSMEIKPAVLEEQTRIEIMAKLNKFIKEVKRQMGESV